MGGGLFLVLKKEKAFFLSKGAPWKSQFIQTQRVVRSQQFAGWAIKQLSILLKSNQFHLTTDLITSQWFFASKRIKKRLEETILTNLMYFPYFFVDFIDQASACWNHIQQPPCTFLMQTIWTEFEITNRLYTNQAVKERLVLIKMEIWKSCPSSYMRSWR